jgi:hypothetical protein
MKKNRLRAVIGIGGIFVAVVLSQVSQPAPQKLSEFVPAGPLLYLEAKDFGSLLGRWLGSQEKQQWLRSANYTAFSESRLFLRLTEAYSNYGGTAGIAADGSLLGSIAGEESAVALYDVGKLEFLYLTRLPSAKAVQTVLWRSRANFSPRKAGGADFYVRTDPSGRVVAFAALNDRLLLATREDLIAGALELMAGGRRSKMIDEGWFARPARGAGAPGDLRLVMNFTALGKSPHFRSYWIQHNVSQVRKFTAGISDLFLNADAIREERLYYRETPVEATVDGRPLAEALRFVPEDAGFFRGWAAPEPGDIAALLKTKLLSPAVARPERSFDVAPSMPKATAVGSEADLDTRIDEPEYKEDGGQLLPGPLNQLLGGDRLTAAVQVEETRTAADAVFIGTNRAIVILRQSAWDAAAVKEVITSSIEGMWTTARLGAGWSEVTGGRVRYFALDGLVPLTVAVEGNRLIVSNSTKLIERILSRASAPVAANVGTYAAGFRHELERRNFAVWMRQLDNVHAPGNSNGGNRPEFLSGNVVSLSDTLARVKSATIGASEQGETMRQTVVYEFGR